MPHLPAELGVRPLLPLVPQAGQVGEVGRRDRVDRPPEVDDGAIPFVVVGDLAGVLALHDADGTVAEGCAFPVAPYRGSGGDPGRQPTTRRTAALYERLRGGYRGVEATQPGRTTAGRSAERRR